MPRTQATYLTSIRERLDESTARFWTDVELRRWINEAARDIARRSETIQEVDTVSITAGTQEYTLASDLLRVHRVEFSPSSDNNVYPLEYVDYTNLDSIWFTNKTIDRGTPRLFTLWGFVPNLKIIFYPTPDRAGTASVYGYRLPAELATDGSQSASNVEVPEGWEDLVVEYVLYQALLKDGNPEWQAAKALYDEKLDAMMQLTRRWTDQAGMIVSDLGHTVPRYLWDFDYMD
ncbi:MAG: hypothetical protein KatS3mg015_2929 [Fimbriimonadales bacterium]|nr:MAG: hypothetical protein KatS3mg015_2929 [Fimbriimonadales bacterium]